MEWIYESKTKKSTGYEDLYDKLSSYKSEDYKKASQEEKDRMIDEVVEIYQSRGIFPIYYFNEEGIREEIQRAIDYKAEIRDDVVNTGAGVCTHLCNFFMPNLYEAYNKYSKANHGKGVEPESGEFKFKDREFFRKVVRFAISCDNSALPESIMAGIRQVGSLPSNFRPMNAQAIYEAYCPEGGVIYDYSCVDDETEFFTGSGWKLLKDYEEGDKVLQYNDDGSANLVEPIRYIHYLSDEPFYEYKGKMFNSCLTGNHTVVYRKRIHDTSKLSEELYRIKMSDIVGKDFRGRIPLSFKFDGNYEIDENLLRLAVAVQADGVLILDRSVNYIKLGISKPRKIVRLKSLLEKCGIEISKVYKYVPKNEKHSTSYDIYFHSKEIWDMFRDAPRKKNFPEEWWNFTRRMKEIVIDEVKYWDGCPNDKGDSNYYNINAYNIDMIQFFYVSTGNGASYHGFGKKETRAGREHHNMCYSTTLRKCTYSEYSIRNGFTEVYKKDKYCFEVPSHNLVLRRQGQVFITGNCGFGGRLTGALTSQKNFTYIGTEPNSKTFENLHRLGHAIESVTGRTNSFKIVKLGSENFKTNPEIFDFSFSSPPYFDLECYCDEPTQCYNAYPNIYDWFDKYVNGTIKNIYNGLKHDRYYAVNIADFNYKGKVMNYVDVWKSYSEKAGFQYVKDLKLRLSVHAGSSESKLKKGKSERIMVFYKP